MEAAPPAAAAVPGVNLQDLIIWFAFDDYNLSTQSRENLEKIANWMSKSAKTGIQVQGNTCDIGTAEYNLALGERRANQTKQNLISLGIASDRISTISYGKERPLDRGHTEEAWAANRRAHIVVLSK